MINVVFSEAGHRLDRHLREKPEERQPSPQERTMSDKVRIELTEEQKNQIMEATGKEASAIELTAEELEDRVSPRKSFNVRA